VAFVTSVTSGVLFDRYRRYIIDIARRLAYRQAFERTLQTLQTALLLMGRAKLCDAFSYLLANFLITRSTVAGALSIPPTTLRSVPFRFASLRFARFRRRKRPSTRGEAGNPLTHDASGVSVAET
jgi:hypothetical protein